MQPLRILLSEGSTLSARQTVTVLGRAGHRVDLCDPDPRCLSSWSRYVRRTLRCPAMGEDPEGYLDFVVQHLEQGRYDVLLPVHEQAYLFARYRECIPARVACALAPFEAFERVQSKSAFSVFLAELGLPQPATRVVHDAKSFGSGELPVYVKTAFGTASGGVWKVGDAEQRSAVSAHLTEMNAWDQGVVLQMPAPGALERAQALFDQGRLIAWHAYRQEKPGPGGGDVVKTSCPRPIVGAHLVSMGSALRWHGAFSLDYLWQEAQGRPLYFDANPRLVEPVNVWLSGTDLPSLWLRLALGDKPATQPPGREGVRTRMSLMGLMQAAAKDNSRAAMCTEGFAMLTHRREYKGTVEELTPIWEDPLSVLPLLFVVGTLLANPRNVSKLRAKAASRHTLSAETVRFIHSQRG